VKMAKCIEWMRQHICQSLRLQVVCLRRGEPYTTPERVLLPVGEGAKQPSSSERLNPTPGVVSSAMDTARNLCSNSFLNSQPENAANLSLFGGRITTTHLFLWSFLFAPFITTATWIATPEQHNVRLRTYGQASTTRIYQIFGFAASFRTPYQLNPQCGHGDGRWILYAG
jgi:hypothetical protein